MYGRFLPKAFLLLSVTVAWSSCLGQSEVPAPDAASGRTLVVAGVGTGFAPVDGDWQFHLGDDPRWSQPDLDDSHWESIQADRPWGAQGHASYAGFAWYRRHVQIVPTSSVPVQYQLLIPQARDAYEVYWNGKLVGQYGKVPPHPWWYYSYFARSFPLSGNNSGVLAIRMWKAPLNAFASADAGGFVYDPPQIGGPDSIEYASDFFEWTALRSSLFNYSLVLLRVFIAVLCMVLWFKNRSDQLLVWVSIFTATPVALDMLDYLFRFPIPYQFARAVNQPLYALYSVSLWFLLIALLQLNNRERWVRGTKGLAILTLAAGALDGILAVFWGSATPWMQWTDGVLCAFILCAETFPFLLIALAFRHKLNASRWLVALSALVLEMIHAVADTGALGRRFTHWTLFANLIEAPLFSLQGVEFTPEKITSLALFAAILFAVYRYILEQQARRTALEREMQSAREIQQVLIPDVLPQLKGFALSSAYTPALEVGGDFFQIIPNEDGSAIVSIGDVSGKGLKAAMNVSMIVGVLRAEAGTTASPAAILTSLNRCLVGRMSGGFATGIVFRVDPDGTVTFANAGHLSPFLNGAEMPLLASLPLGLISYSDYSEEVVRLKPGDSLSLYTDGVLEARNHATGELYGFDRMAKMFATLPTAQEACQAAIDFGQDDDITVLMLTRLAEGEEASTTLTTEFLAPVGA